MDISSHTGTRRVVATPQSQPIPGQESRQVVNSAGGFVYALDKWKQLERFLILGTEGGTYYVSEKDFTKQNHANLISCIEANSRRVVEVLTAISTSYRAPKNDYAIYALAMVAAHAANKDDRRLAWSVLTSVCRIGTHLFQFAQYYTAFKGWGRMARKGIANWYLSKGSNQLAYQLLKYQSRNGWSHRDLLRLSHPKTADPMTNSLLHWSVKGEMSSPIHALIEAHRNIHQAWREGGRNLVTNAIQDHRLTPEMLPTELLKEAWVWDAMMPHLGETALLRNLGRMSALGMFDPFTAPAVVTRLLDPEFLRKGKLHPFAILQALTQYAAGHGDKGSLTWKVSPSIVDALNLCLENSFQTVAPTGKRVLHALDISGSMDSSFIQGSNISCRVAAVVMALAAVRGETFTHTIAFDHAVRGLPYTKLTRLADAIRMTSGWQGGRTDCSIPMQLATQEKWDVDAFVVWTDNETWSGKIHPSQALRQYRNVMNKPDAKLIVCGMTSSGFTIADPSDAGMLDVVGMDASVSQIIHSMLAD